MGRRKAVSGNVNTRSTREAPKPADPPAPKKGGDRGRKRAAPAETPTPREERNLRRAQEAQSRTPEGLRKEANSKKAAERSQPSPDQDQVVRKEAEAGEKPAAKKPAAKKPAAKKATNTKGHRRGIKVTKSLSYPIYKKLPPGQVRPTPPPPPPPPPLLSPTSAMTHHVSLVSLTHTVAPKLAAHVDARRGPHHQEREGGGHRQEEDPRTVLRVRLRRLLVRVRYPEPDRHLLPVRRESAAGCGKAVTPSEACRQVGVHTDEPQDWGVGVRGPALSHERLPVRVAGSSLRVGGSD